MTADRKNDGGGRRRVIVVTDGDSLARRALQMAARRTGCRLISRSAGNPTPLGGVELVELIQSARYDPVIVMFDDNGDASQSHAEQALSVLLTHPQMDVIGVVAVASHTEGAVGTAVDFSITAGGQLVQTAVDKEGEPVAGYILCGDTVDILERYSIPVIVGVGDIGKMNGRDAPERGSPISTAAIQAILNRGKVGLQESR